MKQLGELVASKVTRLDKVINEVINYNKLHGCCSVFKEAFESIKFQIAVMIYFSFVTLLFFFLEI